IDSSPLQQLLMGLTGWLARRDHLRYRSEPAPASSFVRDCHGRGNSTDDAGDENELSPDLTFIRDASGVPRCPPRFQSASGAVATAECPPVLTGTAAVASWGSLQPSKVCLVRAESREGRRAQESVDAAVYRVLCEQFTAEDARSRDRV